MNTKMADSESNLSGGASATDNGKTGDKERDVQNQEQGIICGYCQRKFNSEIILYYHVQRLHGKFDPKQAAIPVEWGAPVKRSITCKRQHVHKPY